MGESPPLGLGVGHMTKRIRFDHTVVGEPLRDHLTRHHRLPRHRKTEDEAERAAVAVLDFVRRADASHELVSSRELNDNGNLPENLLNEAVQRRLCQLKTITSDLNTYAQADRNLKLNDGHRPACS
jgi:hypothetical protein